MQNLRGGVAAFAFVTCLACAQGPSDTSPIDGLSDASVAANPDASAAGSPDASLAAAPDASVPDFTVLPSPVYLRRQSFSTNTTEEAVDGNRNVWFRRSLVPPNGEVFQDVGITNASTVSTLAQAFALLPDPPVACAISTNRTLIRIDASGVTTTWAVCGSDNRGVAAPYENAFLAFPALASF